MHQRDKADEYYRMAECIAYGTHDDVVRTYDAAMKPDSFGIDTLEIDQIQQYLQLRQ